MRVKRHLVVMVAVIATAFTFSTARRAMAACTLIDVSGPNSIGFSVLTLAGHTYTVTLSFNGVEDKNYPRTFTETSNGAFGLSAGGTNSHSHATFVDDSIDCGPAVTWFTPNDARISGEPGDRLALYCNSTTNPPTLGVILINDQGQGFSGLTFDYGKLKAAGKAGITATSATGGNSVSASTDANGNIFASWTGQYGANGQGIFAKSASCNFPS